MLDCDQTWSLTIVFLENRVKLTLDFVEHLWQLLEQEVGCHWWHLPWWFLTSKIQIFFRYFSHLVEPSMNRFDLIIDSGCALLQHIYLQFPVSCSVSTGGEWHSNIISAGIWNESKWTLLLNNRPRISNTYKRHCS